MRTRKLWCVLLVLWIESDVLSAKTTKKYRSTSAEVLEESTTALRIEDNEALGDTTQNYELSRKFTEIENVTTVPEESSVETTEEITKLAEETTSENVAETTYEIVPTVAEIKETPYENSDSVELLFLPYTEDELSELSKKVVISYGCPVGHSRPCVPKCCNLNESHTNFSFGHENRTECVPSSEDDFWLSFADCPQSAENKTVPLEDRYEYFIGIPCTTGKYILDPDVYPEDVYSIYSNGSLFYAGKFFAMSDYCIDNVDSQIRVFVCFETTLDATAEFYHILYPVGQLLSIPFLLATALTYLAMEKFRDLQGKSLVCHVLSLAVAFFFLALVQLAGPDLNHAVCTAAAFIIQFSFVACFFWLNVLSYDSYRNIHDDFRTVYNKGSIRSEKRKFILYSLYAWNGPMILFIVSLVLDTAPGIPDSFLKPQFGARSCWFSSETAALPYFFGPVGILLSINLIFFGLSVYTIIKQKNAEAAEDLTRPHDDDETRRKKKRRKLIHLLKGFKQCFALFLIMGLSWLAEVISWAVGGPRYVWVTTDVINTLQGVLIFIVFVYRPVRVRNAVWKNLTRFWGILTHCSCSYRPETQLQEQYKPQPVPSAIRDQPESGMHPQAIPLTSFQTT